MKAGISFGHAVALAGIVIACSTLQAIAQPAGPSRVLSEPAPRRFTPVTYCPRVTVPPKLDGLLDDDCWKEAAALEEFVPDGKDAPEAEHTEARIARDDKWIYVAVRCKESDMEHLRVFKTGRAMPWDEDSIEIFLDADRGDSRYEQYCANLLGASNLPLPPGQEDAVLVAGKASKDEWTIEARIWIEAISKTPPKAGDVWGLNVCRDRKRENHLEGSSWARIRGSSHMPDLFGLLVFVDTLPATRVSAIDLWDRFEGDNVATITLAGQPGTDASVALTCPSGQKRQDGQIDRRGLPTLGVPYRLAGGFNAMSVTVTAAGQEQPILKADLRAGAVSRPDWAKYVPGYGSLAIMVPKEVAVQDEPLPAQLQVVREGVDQREPQVAWTLKIDGGAPVSIRPSAGMFTLDQKLPDGAAALTAQVGPAGETPLATVERTVRFVGKTLAQCQQQSVDLRARVLKIKPKKNSSETAWSLAKAKAKINRLDEVLKVRDLPRATAAVDEITYHVSCLEQGKLPVWGHHELLYTSGIDHTDQPFMVTVPKDYDPKGKDKRPVLLWLHPFASDTPWPRDLTIGDYMRPMELACMKKGFLLVYPFGRGSQNYYADGRVDVWDVWKIVNQRWRIDPDRVYLAGFSMGGYGTALLSADRPQIFAAAAVYSGWMWPGQAGNIRYLPIRVEAGGQESSATEMPGWIEAIKAVPGRTAEAFCIAHPNEGHSIDYLDFEALLDWFSRNRRVADPPVVTFTSHELRYASSYWVSIEAFEQYGESASVDARIEDGVLKATTANVAQIVFSPPQRLLPKGKLLGLVVNGKDVPIKKAANPIRVACATRPAATPAADLRPVARKTSELPGPITDAYTGPLMLVVAGNGDFAACAKSAERISNRWAKWHHGKLDPLLEGKARTKELADHNVILVGTWQQEGLMAKVAQAGVVSIDAKQIRLGSRPAYEGSDRGIIFIQPNPLNPARYVLVVTGYSEAGVEAACKLFEQERFRGDYVVTPSGAQTDLDLLSGYFDAYWR